MHASVHATIRRDARQHDRWNLVYAPPMKYNRLFIFDSRLFHAESEGFGDSVTNGRLVQIFNFKSEPPEDLVETGLR
jgi:hypothetical protein